MNFTPNEHVENAKEYNKWVDKLNALDPDYPVPFTKLDESLGLSDKQQVSAIEEMYSVLDKRYQELKIGKYEHV